MGKDRITCQSAFVHRAPSSTEIVLGRLSSAETGSFSTSILGSLHVTPTSRDMAFLCPLLRSLVHEPHFQDSFPAFGILTTVQMEVQRGAAGGSLDPVSTGHLLSRPGKTFAIFIHDQLLRLLALFLPHTSTQNSACCTVKIFCLSPSKKTKKLLKIQRAISHAHMVGL